MLTERAVVGETCIQTDLNPDRKGIRNEEVVAAKYVGQLGEREFALEDLWRH